MDDWLKTISALTVPAEHMAVDVLVLVVLFAAPAYRKRVKKILMTKVAQAQITRAMMTNIVRLHASALQEYFKILVALADMFMRAPQLTVQTFGGSLYAALFASYTAYYRQEVIGALIAHVGSGVVRLLLSIFLMC